MACLQGRLEILNKNVPIFGCETLNSLDEYRDSQGALEGAWYETTDVSEAFENEYFKKYSNVSVLSGAAGFYDIAKFILPNITDLRESNEVLAAIKETKITNGALGSYQVENHDGDQYFGFKLGIRKLENGAIRKIN